ncbi:hypothetical protein [Vagococcus sp. WN89Y]|uniref:hypothetical protein n=1 Tax=Vagococcus sp. WN89Y TaxID=3457258 RepID=UPI003FCC504F
MTAINNIASAYQSRSATDSDELSFNDKFLNYIKENKPDGDLKSLMEEAKELFPQENMTMSQLNSALLYADTILRANPDYQEYTSETLDKNSVQMLGINMLTNKMMEKFTSSEEEQDFL